LLLLQIVLNFIFWLKNIKLMKNNSYFFLVTIFLLFLSVVGCEREEASISGPQILWETKITTTYSYSGGALSGFNTYKEFSVINDR